MSCVEPGCGGASAAARVLPARGPHDVAWLLAFLGAHAVAGVETWDGRTYARSVSVEGRPQVLRVRAHRDGVESLGTPDGDAAVVHLLGLHDDPSVAEAALGRDAALGPLVRRRPGVRAPGSADHGETLVRTVIGQQVSLAAARTVTGRLVAEHGRPLPAHLVAPGGPTHLFPSPERLAGVDPASLPMPRARGRTVVAVAGALADDPGVVADDATLLALPGVGPWTVDYVRLRTRRDPDVFLSTDLAVRRQLSRLLPGPAATARAVVAGWAPHRSLALVHLWADYLDGTHDDAHDDAHKGTPEDAPTAATAGAVPA